MVNLIAKYSFSIHRNFCLYHLSLLAFRLALLSCRVPLRQLGSSRRWMNMTRSTNGQKASDNVSEKCVMYYCHDTTARQKIEVRTFSSTFFRNLLRIDWRGAKSWRKARRQRWHEVLTRAAATTKHTPHQPKLGLDGLGSYLTQRPRTDDA